MIRKRLDKTETQVEEAVDQKDASSSKDDHNQLVDFLKANPYLKPLVQQIKEKRQTLHFKNKPADNQEHDE
ncbi:hypothetical protein [Bacillus cihuensis]|uniref:hypothetical protein n=1 Tax=Bacillus cihuensis TaxID=1208599 RepID=UPI00041162E1|nr:hypothetical protein [Bacillus cihuensis]